MFHVEPTGGAIFFDGGCREVESGKGWLTSLSRSKSGVGPAAERAHEPMGRWSRSRSSRGSAEVIRTKDRSWIRLPKAPIHGWIEMRCARPTTPSWTFVPSMGTECSGLGFQDFGDSPWACFCRMEVATVV